jgi:hypothetical protein
MMGFPPKEELMLVEEIRPNGLNATPSVVVSVVAALLLEG